MTIALDLLRVEATEVDPLYTTHPGDYVTRGNHWLAAAQTYLNSPISTKEPADQVQAVGHRVNVVVHHLNELWDKGYRGPAKPTLNMYFDVVKDLKAGVFDTVQSAGEAVDPTRPSGSKNFQYIVTAAVVLLMVAAFLSKK